MFFLKYSDLLVNLIERDLKLKYRGSSIGFLWSLVNPLIMIVIYTWVFKTILKNPTPNFSMVLMSGLLPWNFFAAGLTTSVNSFTGNASLLTKVKIPKYILVFSSILFNFIIFLMMVVLIIISMYFFDVPYTVNLFLLPLAMIIQLTFLLSIGMILAISNVFFQDTSHLVEVLVMAWFWLTPVIYQFNLIPQEFRFFVSLNPMTLIINLYQSAVMGTAIYTNVFVGSVIILLTFIIAVLLYKKYSGKISELV